jgi:hypothetical protein
MNQIRYIFFGRTCDYPNDVEKAGLNVTDYSQSYESSFVYSLIVKLK